MPLQEHEVEQVRTAVREHLPGAVRDLEALVRIPSIAFPGFPPEPVAAAAALVMEQLRSAGMPRVELLAIPDSPDAVFAEIPAPAGAPTVLLYAHYDVQPAGDESLWRSEPFEPTRRDGRLYGRGAADDKSGVVLHALALRALGDQLGVGVKVLVEGSEECGGGQIEDVVRARADLLAADVIVVADVGNWKLGVPTTTSSLRGMAAVVVEVATLRGAVHSGMFGGPAPDPMTAMVRLLASLHDDAGDVAVAGLAPIPYDGVDYPEDAYREVAGVLEGVGLVGTGSIAERLYARPSLTVVGIDAPAVAVAPNAVLPSVRAKISIRVAPGQDPAEAQRAVAAHLEARAPWRVRLTVTPTEAGEGFAAQTDGEVYALAERCLEAAYGTPAVRVGSGGSIPLVSALAEALPEAEIVLWGAQDEGAQIHAPNESVDLSELEHAALAEALLLAELAVR